MKRLKRGAVRGISLKLQEEERERRMDSVPDRSVLDVPTIELVGLKEVQAMLESLDFPKASLPTLSEASQTKKKYNNSKKKEGAAPAGFN